MLHVFHLNVGRQLNLDVCFSAQPVDRLQTEVERLTQVPKQDQILLISGGIVLAPEKCLSSYTSAGSESNPIFLVSRLQEVASSRDQHQQCEEQFQPMSQLQSDLDVEVSNLCRQSTKTATNAALGAQLAERLLTASERLAEYCSHLVAEQHHVYQGWGSVVANLDDIIDAFHRHIRKLRRKRECLLQNRTAIGEMLLKLPTYLEMLRRLPFIEPLVETNYVVPGEQRRSGSDESASSSSPTAAASPLLNVLSWIDGLGASGLGADVHLTDLANQIEQDLQKVLDPAVQTSMDEWETFTKCRACDGQMKKVRGITQRFTQLNTYVQRICKLRDDQRNFAQCIQTLEQKCHGCTDPAVLGDINTGIGNFLLEMVKNHKWMLDVAKRFGMAKLELLVNIRRRLEWVIETHEYIHTADTNVFVHRERVGVLLRRLKLLRQLRTAPQLYAQCVAEINRRRTLRRRFMEWAKQVASRSSKLHSEETKLRKEMAARLEDHFLSILFQCCLDKAFPLFAVDPPDNFDTALPFIEFEHLEQIRSAVPELSGYLHRSSSSSVSDVHGCCKVDGVAGAPGKILFYSSTPPSDDQRIGTSSPSFFHSLENIPFSSFGSLSHKVYSEADLSSNSEMQLSKRTEDSGSSGERRSLFQRSAPISIPITRNAYSSCMSLFPLPSSL